MIKAFTITDCESMDYPYGIMPFDWLGEILTEEQEKDLMIVGEGFEEYVGDNFKMCMRIIESLNHIKYYVDTSIYEHPIAYQLELLGDDFPQLTIKQATQLFNIQECLDAGCSDDVCVVHDIVFGETHKDTINGCVQREWAEVYSGFVINIQLIKDMSDYYFGYLDKYIINEGTDDSEIIWIPSNRNMRLDDFNEYMGYPNEWEAVEYKPDGYTIDELIGGGSVHNAINNYIDSMAYMYDTGDYRYTFEDMVYNLREGNYRFNIEGEIL